jgi:hypothetical protein
MIGARIESTKKSVIAPLQAFPVEVIMHEAKAA